MSLFEKIKNSKNILEFDKLSYGALMDIIERLSNENKELRKELDKYEEPTILEKKIADFIEWYKDENIEEFRSQTTVNWLAKRLEEFIDKVAAWYELRYPDCEINHMFPSVTDDEVRIDDVMFKDNPYIEMFFNSDSDVRLLEWSSLYNSTAFINSLSGIEKQFLAEPHYYKDIVYYDRSKMPHFHIDNDGTILEAEYLDVFNKEEEGINNREVVGLNIKDIIYLFKEKEIPIPSESELYKEVRKYDNHIYFKYELLNCIMYKIIERGDNRFSPKRAFLFARDFGLDIDIPLKYGIDIYDLGLRPFIDEYLRMGGSKDLVCLNNYFYGNKTDEDSYDKITIDELLKLTENKEKVKKKKYDN